MSIVEIANQVALEFTKERVLESVDKLKREEHGYGCGCIECKRYVVDKYNSWVEFLRPNLDNPDRYMFRVENGEIKKAGE